jgi:UDP-N-acetylmuramyl pentapeptide synthase
VIEARDRDAALDLLRDRLRDGDVVLIKASNGVELFKLVDELRAELARSPR